MVRALGDIVARPQEAQALIDQLEATKARVAAAAARLPFKPRVYFEEWHSPLTCGIQWVSEIISLAGGVDVFADIAPLDPFSARAVTADQILAARPQVILGSWCGQRFDVAQVQTRPGFAELNALMRDVPASDILAPGPAAIERGLVVILSAMADCCGTTLNALSFDA
jgi:iron complex transport system substrate-binding protein